MQSAMLALFENTIRPGERENFARAFAQIAAGQRLPAPTLDALAATLQAEPNDRIRIQALYTLAHAHAYYPQSQALLTAATQDPRPDVQAAAAHGLRIVETKQLYGDREPMAVALDRSLPVESRLKAMGPLKVNRSDPAWRAPAVVAVMAAWAAASYGVFLLYFMGAHMRSTDVWHVLQLAGVLWVAVAVYAAAGWGLHYAVRR